MKLDAAQNEKTSPSFSNQMGMSSCSMYFQIWMPTIPALLDTWILGGAFQALRKVFRGITLPASYNLLGRSRGKNGAAATTAFGSYVDDVVGQLDDVHVVLDDDYGVATVGEPSEHVHQDADILEVEARGRLVEDIKRAARVAFG